MTPKKKYRRKPSPPQGGKRTNVKQTIPISTLDNALRAIKEKTGIAEIPTSAKALKGISRERKENLILAYSRLAKVADITPATKQKVAEYKKAAAIDVAPIGKKYLAVEKINDTTQAKIKQSAPLKGEVMQVKALANGDQFQFITLPFRGDKLSKLAEEVKNHPEWEKYKAKKEVWRIGFRNGNTVYWSAQSFSTLAQALAFAEHYIEGEEDSDAHENSDRSKMRAFVIARAIPNSVAIEERLAEQVEEKKQRTRDADKRRRRFAKLRKERGG